MSRLVNHFIVVVHFRCEKLLMMISKKQTELTNAEKDYLKDISNGNDKIVKFSKAISNLKNKIKYQEIQVSRNAIFLRFI